MDLEPDLNLGIGPDAQMSLRGCGRYGHIHFRGIWHSSGCVKPQSVIWAQHCREQHSLFPFKAQAWQPCKCHGSSLTPRLSRGRGPLQRLLLTCHSYEHMSWEHGSGWSSRAGSAVRRCTAGSPCWQAAVHHGAGLLGLLALSKQLPQHGYQLAAWPGCILPKSTCSIAAWDRSVGVPESNRWWQCPCGPSGASRRC